MQKAFYDMVIQCLILEGLVLTLKVALIVAEKEYYMRRDRMCPLMSSFRAGPFLESPGNFSALSSHF